MIDLTSIETLTTETFKEIYQDKGEQWIITAMVEGSIGYHTPNHAKNLIERALKGEIIDNCERCNACYGNDLLLMMAHDVRALSIIEKDSPGHFKRLIEAIKQISTLDEQHQSTISLLYPTLGV